MPVTTRDVNDVARLVSWKLEKYINDKHRELYFDASAGPRKESYPSWDFKGVNEMVSRDKSDRRRHFRERQLMQKRSTSDSMQGDKIDPVIIDDHLRSVTESEASSLVRFANKIFEHPIGSLQQLLEYKPRPENGAGPDTVQNFNFHVGSCLRSRDYKDYYEKYGLKSGDVSNRLTPKVEHSSRQFTKSSDRELIKIGYDDKENRHNSPAKGAADRRSSQSLKQNYQHWSNQSRYKASVRSLIKLLLDEGTSQTVDSKETRHGPKRKASLKPLGNRDKRKSLVHDTPADAEPSALSTKDYTIDAAFFEQMYKM
ncbi:uncharacterized protein LOC135477653 isoform X2 [Liolophura sinensis]|uniref:uncharacterized protein LOC135477653 isoform X2 n=1 Tax=Liolophura sinensis TaxID=3198878 RepID=UPI0031598B5A